MGTRHGCSPFPRNVVSSYRSLPAVSRSERSRESRVIARKVTFSAFDTLGIYIDQRVRGTLREVRIDAGSMRDGRRSCELKRIVQISTRRVSSRIKQSPRRSIRSDESRRRRRRRRRPRGTYRRRNIGAMPDGRTAARVLFRDLSMSRADLKLRSSRGVSQPGVAYLLELELSYAVNRAPDRPLHPAHPDCDCGSAIGSRSSGVDP